MKRSRVNEILKEAQELLASYNYVLPPFADWSPEQIRGPEGKTIRDRRLGWDITDYGKGRYDELGLFLFTLRNGDLAKMGQKGAMLYAEKMLISGDCQISPMHRHDVKTEDIINRGGGDLVLELFSADESGGIDRSAQVRVLSDANWVEMEAGAHLRLKPGQSVTLTPNIWHAFWGEGGTCLIQEVSTVNDDLTDNIFEQPIGRFSDVEEDEAPLRLLVSDY